MSVAVDAIVLIRLREHQGESVGVRELADLMQVDDQVVEESLDRLEANGTAKVQRVAGLPFWGAALPDQAWGDGTCA